MVQQGLSMDLWYRETRRPARDDTRTTEGLREETTVYPRNKELEDHIERQRCVTDDIGRLPLGILCIMIV